jgi:hypothetical protein
MNMSFAESLTARSIEHAVIGDMTLVMFSNIEAMVLESTTCATLGLQRRQEQTCWPAGNERRTVDYSCWQASD